MSHLAVRTLIEDTVKSLDDSVLFGYARKSDWDSTIKREEKRVRLDTLRSTLSYTEDSYNLTHQYNIFMAFYGLDDIQGAQNETALVLDDTDVMCDNFIQKLNRFSDNEDTTDDINTQNTQISNITKTPFIKDNDATSGFVLNFTFTVPDSFDYCSI